MCTAELPGTEPFLTVLCATGAGRVLKVLDKGFLLLVLEDD